MGVSLYQTDETSWTGFAFCVSGLVKNKIGILCYAFVQLRSLIYFFLLKRPRYADPKEVYLLFLASCGNT